jgi:hypothetical protein
MYKTIKGSSCSNRNNQWLVVLVKSESEKKNYFKSNYYTYLQHILNLILLNLQIRDETKQVETNAFSYE